MQTQNPEYLYRITNFRHVVDVFTSRQLHLVPPSTWSDPFEALLRHKRSHALFAQCWCKKAVSDAMWKLYSPNHTAIRIRTTRTKLSDWAASQTECEAWVQDVAYKRPSRIRSQLLLLSQNLKDHYTIAEAASVLFLKRDAFEHENEVRIVCHDKRVLDGDKNSPSLRLPVDPHEFIESIMFDPLVDPAFYQACAHYLRSVVQFKRSVGKSALYRLQNQLVIE